MTNEAELKNQLLAFFKEANQDNDSIFLVDFVQNPKSNAFMFLVDGDESITLADIAKISRGISNQIDELIADETPFRFEVSTPGADKPLKHQRQYKKHIGRTIEIMQTNGQKLEGELLAVEESQIEVETPANKKNKTEAQQHIVAFDKINESLIKLKF
jgi:ribosome maturation factor RimP